MQHNLHSSTSIATQKHSKFCFTIHTPLLGGRYLPRHSFPPNFLPTYSQWLPGTLASFLFMHFCVSTHTHISVIHCTVPANRDLCESHPMTWSQFDQLVESRQLLFLFFSLVIVGGFRNNAVLLYRSHNANFLKKVCGAYAAMCRPQQKDDHKEQEKEG